MSKKTEVTVKSNGLRNELKEIRKSIDKLTITLQRQTETFDHIADSLARLIISQTNKQNENIKNNATGEYWGDSIDGMYFTTSSTEAKTSIESKNVSKNN